MGVSDRQQTLERFSAVFTPDLGKAQEEPLLRSEAIFFFGWCLCVFAGVAVRHKRDANAAIVGSIFTKTQAAIQVNIIHRDKCAVFVSKAFCPPLEFMAIGIGPPVSKVTLAIKFPAL